MKLVFSEHISDYSHYIYPYVIWGFREPHETPAQMFDAGFLPSALSLERFYLVRQLRVDLKKFEPSSENRRVLRKCPDVTFELVPRAQYEFTPERRERFKKYADVRFGDDVMSFNRLDALFSSQVVSHLMVFTDSKTGAEIGTVVLHLEGDAMAYYYFGFYELDYPERSLGLYMMTSAVAEFAARGIRHLYLGTCYSQRALYKTQFPGLEFFNGFRWSQDLKELKYLLQRDKPDASQHLLDVEEFRQLFYGSDMTRIRAASQFSGSVRPLS